MLDSIGGNQERPHHDAAKGTFSVTTSGHGGRRPGAGRPRAYTEPMVRKTILLPASFLPLLEREGSGQPLRRGPDRDRTGLQPARLLLVPHGPLRPRTTLAIRRRMPIQETAAGSAADRTVLIANAPRATPAREKGRNFGIIMDRQVA